MDNERIKDSEAQLTSLYVLLGRFLYEKLKAGVVSYSFLPPQEELMAKAKALIGKVGQKDNGIERRGQLEPYTKLIVDLRLFAKKIFEIENDLNECLALGLSLEGNPEVSMPESAVQDKIREIAQLLQMSEREIKLMREKKRTFFLENGPGESWGQDEEDFLKQAAGEVAMMAGRINALVGDAAALFAQMKKAYENGLGAGGMAEAQKTEGPAGPLPEAQVEPADDPKSVADLLHTLINADAAERTRILQELVHNPAKKASSLVYKCVKNADQLLRKKFLSLVAETGSPKLIELYRWLIADNEAGLRLQGIMGLVKLGSDEALQVITSVVNDADPEIRRFIVNYLEHSGVEPQATALARLASDSDDTVRRIAIRKLGAMANQFAFVNLVPKLEDPKNKIRKEAILALMTMIGTDLGYNYAASEAIRNERVQQWKKLAEQSYNDADLIRHLRAKYLHKGKDKGTDTGAED